MRLKGRKILVTGGASGIGRSVVETFLREGAKVVVLDRNETALDQLKGQLPSSVLLRADISEPDMVFRTVALAAERLHGLDGVANVAGVSTRKSFEATTLETMRSDIAVNLLGPFLVSKAAYPFLKEAGRSTIVNVASGLALRPAEGRTAYAASKGGLVAMSKAMAVDMGPVNIRVNVVCPGLVDTPMLSQGGHDTAFSELQMQRLLERRILRRIATPQEIADAILFLTSDESTYMTASVIAVDGGGAMH